MSGGILIQPVNEVRTSRKPLPTEAKSCGNCQHWYEFPADRQTDLNTLRGDCRQGPMHIVVIPIGINQDGAIICSKGIEYPAPPQEFPACGQFQRRDKSDSDLASLARRASA